MFGFSAAPGVGMPSLHWHMVHVPLRQTSPRRLLGFSFPPFLSHRFCVFSAAPMAVFPAAPGVGMPSLHWHRVHVPLRHPSPRRQQGVPFFSILPFSLASFLRFFRSRQSSSFPLRRRSACLRSTGPGARSAPANLPPSSTWIFCFSFSFSSLFD